MEVSQIPIKINQTNSADGGKQKISAQADGTPSFSGHILAIVNLLNQSSKDGKQPASPNSVKDGNIPADNKAVSDGDIVQLSSLLAALAAAIQTGNPLQESSTEIIPNQPDKVDISAVLSRLAQKLEGTLQQTPQNENQQIMNLKQLIGDLQTELQNGKGFPNDLDEKIKKILDELKTVNTDQADAAPSDTLKNNNNTDHIDATLSGSLKNSNNTDQVNVRPSGTLKNSGNAPVSISKLSLDKNQVAMPVLTAQRMTVRGQNNLDKNAAIHQEGDQMRQDGTLFTANQPLQEAGNTLSKEVPTSPVLAVSDFVPEVSEWMDRFISMTNGQKGSAEAKFSLYPEHLGPMEIKITSLQGEISAQIVTGTTMAKEALEGQLPQLREALMQHGLQVQKLDIVQQPMGSNPSNLSFSQGGYGSSQEQKQFQQARGGSKKQDKDDQYELESVPSSIPYSGTAPNLSSRIDFTA